jgi:hypothetical protein
MLRKVPEADNDILWSWTHIFRIADKKSGKPILELRNHSNKCLPPFS